jgi:putative spermidine/putrescine transport system ATP-binding protein
MARVRLSNVEKRYGDIVAVAGIDLDIAEGEFLTLLGPSGCGKTTSLRMVAGFVRPTRGKILIDSDDVTATPPQKRSIGMVFQDYALFPHLTIAENIGFGLVERGQGRGAVAARVRELLDLVQLPGVGERYPSEISGGQQQRIALARAVAHTPRVLLMDEPLGALDLKLREAMQIELRRIQQTLRITTVYVTHDQTEAMSMSDRIAVMNQGRIEQLDTPTRIYDAPATRFVADFVGKINFLEGRIEEAAGGLSRVATPFGTFLARSPAQPAPTVALAVRPEHLRLLQAGEREDGLNVIEGRIEAKTFVGNLLQVIVALKGDGPRLQVEERPGNVDASVGEVVRVGWRPENGIVLPDL